MKECFGYIRISTVKQGDGVSLDAQKEAIEIFAKRQKIRISAWYEEKETAAKSGRPVFNAMVKALKAGKASGMIIHRIDRSSRNLKDWATISDLSDAGIDVYFATETLDFKSRGGRLTADIQAVIAADYIRNLSIEARKGIRGRLKQGLYPWAAPIGYLDNGSGKPKTIDPERAPLVRELFERYLTGEYSIRSLHNCMFERGLTNKANRPISKRTVENTLNNPFYCGLMRNGRTKQLFPGIHETLITPAQFERVQEIKAGRYVKKKTRHNHLLRKFFYCSLCSTVLTAELQKNRVYYRCHTISCPTNSVREDMLESAIEKALGTYQFSEDDHQSMGVGYDSWTDESKKKEVRSIQLRISQAEARLGKVTDLLIDDRIDQRAHDQKRSEIQIEISKLHDQLLDLEENYINSTDRQKFFELMKNLTGLYISSNSEEKRLLVKNCFSNRYWDGKNVGLEPSNLITTVKKTASVPYSGEIRDTIRTLLQVFDKSGSSQKKKNESWKKNFKHQKFLQNV